jgi:tight adherence protein B
MKLGRNKTSERLEVFLGSGAAKAKSKDALADIDQRVTQSKEGSKIQRDLARADLKLRVLEWIAIKIGTALLVAGLLAWFGREIQPFAAAMVGLVAGAFVPDLYLKYLSGRRIKMFNDQLGDTITMMANALRGGYSFLQTMQLVSNEAPDPTATEFRRVVQEVGLGRTTQDALDGLMRRVPSEDLDLLITAVNIQHEVGGNLAQILDSIGHTIRERVRILGEIQTLTAQGRLSGYIITALPFVVGFYISAVNPDYMAPIFTFGLPPDAWCCMPGCAVVMIAIGYYWITKIVDIEV